jgi:phospholipid/cholesterol/gamma-HCH transport system substrate-binding protein
MQQSKVLETWVGLFVALGVVALFFLAMKVSNLGELQTKDNSFRIIARFQNAGSLRARAPVSMAGVRIGRVSSIRFDKENYEAVVEMRIDPEYDTIPSDTSANVLTAGLLGEQYIGLSAGGSDEYLKDGDEIELTQSALVLEEVVSRFLFNKAEGGAEKKEAAPAEAGASAKDQEPEHAVADTEAAVAKPKPPAKNAEEPPAAHKPKADAAEEAGHAHKPKPAAHGKAAEEPPVEQHKPKAAAHGKGAEESAPAHKAAKPAAKTSASP